ncbi:MAG TPA: peptidylprolyl isomerase [Pyrinomonadaceae bacterium]|nr:peptidylprolyl isomerase [Pyrinomonadaceae bacterium]
MKICPQCNTEYENNVDVCPKDNTILSDTDNQSTVSGAETVPNNTAETPQNSTVNTNTAAKGSSALPKALAVLAVLLALGIGLVVWKTKFAGHHDEVLTRVSKEDMQLLLKDANPMQLKAIGESPEQKKKVAESLRQLLAVASQARKDGLAEDPNVKHELESIRSLIIASLYDKKINEGKAQMPPFSFITEDQVNEFWSNNTARRETEFKQFLDAKIALARESGKFPKDKELEEEEIKQAKDDFAKVKIYEEEAVAKRSELGEEFNRELELQVGLQQAQFLATTYAQKTLVEKIKVSDEDVKNYIASHPEFDTKDKRVKAEQVLSRAKAGEDFGKLAKEFSEDPGSKEKGGLYENVAINSGFDKNFESSALALEPGQITENLVETPFGFHIIKLEKKGEGKDPKGEPTQTYDVRHILIGTTITDPENPMARPMPISVKVKSQLEEEKQKQVLDEIVKNNPVEVPEDFNVPEPTADQMQQMMKQQQQMQQQQMQQMQGMPPGGMPSDEDEEEEAPKGKTPPNPQPKKK